MKHKYAADCHNHSNCSPDGEHSPQAMADRAAALGLRVYTLTDHCECNEYEEKYRDRAAAAWEEMEKLRLPQGPEFLRGIELGQLTQNPGAAREVLATYAYDFAIGSLHSIRDRQDFYYMDCREKSREEIAGLLDEYWDEVLEMIDCGGFDSLGHLTYPLRYIQGEQGVQVDLERHSDKLDRIFRSLIDHEKALEVNSSGIFGKLGETMPGPGLLRRYYELGGRLLTFGSDAHCTENLAQGIDSAMDMAREAGFTQFTVYRQHRPVMLPLE